MAETVLGAWDEPQEDTTTSTLGAWDEPTEDPTAQINGDRSGYPGGPPVDLSAVKEEGDAGFIEPKKPSVIDQWNAEEDFSPASDTGTKLDQLKSRFESSGDRENLDFVLKMKDIYSRPESKGKPMPAGKGVAFVDTPEKKALREATPYLDKLYNDYIAGPNQMEKDYQWFASGPNAYKKSIPENYKPTTSEYTEGPGRADPEGWYKKLVEFADQKDKEAGVSPQFSINPTLSSKRGASSGKRVLNGVEIPRPEDYKAQGELSDFDPTSVFPGTNMPYLNSLMKDSGREIARKVSLVGAAAVDEYFGTNWTKEVDKFIAKPAVAKSSIDRMARDFTKITMTSGPTLKGVTGLVSKIGESRVIATNIAKALGFITTAVVTTAAMNPEDKTLVLGKNSLLGLWDKYDAHDKQNGTLSSEILANTFYQAIENGAGDALFKGIGETVRFANSYIQGVTHPLMNVIGKDNTRRSITLGKQILQKAGITPDKRNLDFIQKSLSEGNEKTFENKASKALGDMGEIAIPDVNVNLPTFRKLADSADQRMAEIKTQLDNSGMNAKEADKLKEEYSWLENMKESFLGADRNAEINNLPGHTVMSGKVVSGLKEGVEKGVEDRGGFGNIEKAGQQIGESGIVDVDPSKSKPLSSINQDVTDLKTNSEEFKNYDLQIKEALKENPQLNAQILQLEKEVSLDGKKSKWDSMDSLLQKIALGVQTINKKSRELYGKFPEGVPIPDQPSFTQAYKEAAGLNVKDGEKGINYLPKSLQDMLTRGADGALEVGEGKLSFDSKFLFTEFRPKLMAEISAEMHSSRPNIEKLNALVALKENLDSTQLKGLAEDTEVGQGAFNIYKEAQDYYGNVVTPLRKGNTEMSKIFDSFDEASNVKPFRDEMSSENPDITVARRASNRFTDVTQTAVLGTSDSKIAAGENILDFLRREEVPNGAAEDFVNVHLADMINPIRDMIEQGKDISGVTARSLLAQSEKNGRLISKEFPEATTQLENWLTKLQNLHGDKNKMKTALQELDLSVKASEDKLKSQAALNFLFSKGDGTYEVTKNPGETLIKFLSDDRNIDKVQNAVDAINQSGNLAAAEGLKGAYTQVIENVFKRVRDGQYEIDEVLANKILDPNSSISKMGDTIFESGKNPKEETQQLEFIRGLVSYAQKYKEGSKTLANQGVQLSSLDNQAKEAFGKGTMWVFGVLNSAATRAKSLGYSGINSMGTLSMDNIKNIFDELHTDPKGMLATINALRNETADKTARNAALDKIASYMFRRTPDVFLGGDRAKDNQTLTPEQKMKIPAGVK